MKHYKKVLRLKRGYKIALAIIGAYCIIALLALVLTYRIESIKDTTPKSIEIFKNN